MGVGGSWSPDCPLIDVVISQRLKVRGFLGTRDDKICLYASTEKKQALDYARGGSEAYLKVLEPQIGTVLSWVPNMGDMLLNFESHLRGLHWEGVSQYRGVKFGPLVRDIAGDIDIAETYLRYGRQKRAIGAMIDSFLEPLEVREHVVDADTDIDEIIEGHIGELWITGACFVHDYDPLVHQPRPSITPTSGMII
jgi:hypothetical protein